MEVPPQGVRVLLVLHLRVVGRNPSVVVGVGQVGGGRHLDVRDRHGFHRLREIGELEDGVGVYPPGMGVSPVHGRVLVLNDARLVAAAAPAHRVAGRVPDATTAAASHTGTDSVLGFHHRPHVHSGGDECGEPSRAEARGEDGRGEEGRRAGVVEWAEVRAPRGTHVAGLGIVFLQSVCCSLQEDVL